jgi:glycosyltransferase involved in cell wall biosynthesis
MMNCSDSRPANKPLVSVIIPAYNAASFITETLESVFAQTFKDFEVIIINDGSPDTEEFERILQPYMNRVVYLKQENQGPSAARNLGILRARGEYLAFLDADDLWLPEYLNEQMKLFKQTASLDLVYADVLQYHSSTADGVPYSQDCPSRGPVTFESLVTEECQIPTSSVIVRKQVVQDAGLFDEQLWRCEDYDLWLRIAYRGARMAHQQKVLGSSRVRLDSLAAQQIKMLQGMVRVLSKLETELTVTPESRALLQREGAKARAKLDLERGKICLQQGRLDEAHNALCNANAFFHRRTLSLFLFALRLSPKLAEYVARMWGRLVVCLWRFRNYKRRNWPLSWTARGLDSFD